MWGPQSWLLVGKCPGVLMELDYSGAPGPPFSWASWAPPEVICWEDSGSEKPSAFTTVVKPGPIPYTLNYH